MTLSKEEIDMMWAAQKETHELRDSLGLHGVGHKNGGAIGLVLPRIPGRILFSHWNLMGAFLGPIVSFPMLGHRSRMAEVHSRRLVRQDG